MKRKITSALTILLFLIFSVSLTLAEGVPIEEYTDERSKVTNITYTPLSNGDILIEWEEISYAKEYLLMYKVENWEYYRSVTVNSSRAILDSLIPGMTYEIIIGYSPVMGSLPEQQSITYDKYTVPKPFFDEYITGDQYLDLSVKRVSLSEIEKNPLMSIKLTISWPRQLKYTRHYKGKVVLKTPFGYARIVATFSELTFDNQHSGATTVFSLSEWFDSVEETFGSIPTGDYTFEFYTDGKFYDYATFIVTN